MADLRALLVELGYERIATLLQSGNVILDSAGVPDVAAIESAIIRNTGVNSRCVLLPLEEFRSLVAANPLLEVGDDLSKLVVTFVAEEIDEQAITRPTDDDLAPERLVFTPRALYQWFPDGILASKLKPSFWKQFGPATTARNVRTANRILDLADSVKV